MDTTTSETHLDDRYQHQLGGRRRSACSGQAGSLAHKPATVTLNAHKDDITYLVGQHAQQRDADHALPGAQRLAGRRPRRAHRLRRRQDHLRNRWPE